MPMHLLLDRKREVHTIFSPSVETNRWRSKTCPQMTSTCSVLQLAVQGLRDEEAGSNPASPKAGEVPVVAFRPAHQTE